MKREQREPEREGKARRRGREIRGKSRGRKGCS